MKTRNIGVVRLSLIIGIAIVGGIVSSASAANLWSTDIQAAGSSAFGQQDPPILMVGPDPIYSLGNVWNAFDVPGHALPAALNPSMNLVNDDGNATSVNFALTGSAAGFSNGGAGQALFRDYVFDSAGNAGPDYSWDITGLDKKRRYDLMLYGGVARPATFVVDTDGDGSLANNTPVTAGASSAVRLNQIPTDSTGKITGNMGVGIGGEQNWSAFQLLAHPWVHGRLWSVDIQGSGSGLFGQSNPPLLMNGVEPNYNFGNLWNAFNVPGHALPAQPNPSMALLDSTGNPWGVTFSITGPTAGWGGAGGSGGRLDLVRDYLFVNAGSVAGVLTLDWSISGLDANHIYELYAYGGVARDMALTVDIDGDGSLVNNALVIVDGNGVLFGLITPDALGNIIGRVANGTGDPEGNWAGFQLRDITPIPEPATLSLLGLGALGLVRRRRRRK